MATEPLNRIVLAARSVADDLSYAALAGIARVLSTRTTEYRIIGGLMVTALAARWDLGGRLYREALDADLGVPPVVLRDLDLADRLKAAGYEQVAGDRFERQVPDVPAGVSGVAPPTYRAAIDVLVPRLHKPPTTQRAHRPRPHHNRGPGPSRSRWRAIQSN